MARFAVILPAAGKSTRFGDANYKKPFAPLDGRPIWLHSAEKFVNRSDVGRVILVVAKQDREHFADKFAGTAALLGIQVVDGGDERFQSVENGLKTVPSDCDFIAIHDAARPCIAAEWIDQVFADAIRHGAAILAAPIHSTLKRANEDNTINATVSRENIWAAQTPQVFRRDWLEQAFAKRGDRAVTDEAELVEAAGFPIQLTPGSPINLKITTADDLKLAAHLLRALPAPKLANPNHPFEDGDLWR